MIDCRRREALSFLATVHLRWSGRNPQQRRVGCGKNLNHQTDHGTRTRNVRRGIFGHSR